MTAKRVRRQTTALGPLGVALGENRGRDRGRDRGRNRDWGTTARMEQWQGIAWIARSRMRMPGGAWGCLGMPGDVRGG